MVSHHLPAAPVVNVFSVGMELTKVFITHVYKGMLKSFYYYI